MNKYAIIALILLTLTLGCTQVPYKSYSSQTYSFEYPEHWAQGIKEESLVLYLSQSNDKEFVGFKVFDDDPDSIEISLDIASNTIGPNTIYEDGSTEINGERAVFRKIGYKTGDKRLIEKVVVVKKNSRTYVIDYRAYDDNYQVNAMHFEKLLNSFKMHGFVNLLK